MASGASELMPCIRMIDTRLFHVTFVSFAASRQTALIRLMDKGTGASASVPFVYRKIKKGAPCLPDESPFCRMRRKAAASDLFFRGPS